MAVLQLDVTMRPIELVSLEDAIGKLFLEEAWAYESDTVEVFRGPDYGGARARVVIPRPHIIVLREPVEYDYVKLSQKAVKHVSKRVLYARDRYTCQYCGDPVERPNATMDHVKPAHLFATRAEATTWDNVTTACKPCNNRKGGRLPVKCGMYPKTTPKAPTYVQAKFAGKLHRLQAEYVAMYHKLEVEHLL